MEPPFGLEEKLRRKRRQKIRNILFKLAIMFLLFEFGMQLGLIRGIRKGRKEGRAIGIHDGRLMEQQAPEYKKAKAKWMQEITDMTNAKFEAELKRMGLYNCGEK